MATASHEGFSEFQELQNDIFWVGLNSTTGAVALLDVDDQDGRVSLRTQDTGVEIHLSSTQCAANYGDRSVTFSPGAYCSIPDNSGVQPPSSSASHQLYCPIFAVINMLTASIIDKGTMELLMTLPLMQHLHQYHHEFGHRNYMYGPHFPHRVVLPDKIPAPAPAPSRVCARKSVELLLPSASDTSLSFITGVAKRRVTVFRDIASDLIERCELLKHTDKMMSRYGDDRVSITVLDNRQSKPPFTQESSTLRDHLKATASNPFYAANHYLQQVDVQSCFPRLMQDAGIPPAGPHLMHTAIKDCHPPTLFIGSKGTRTSLHFDRSERSHRSDMLRQDDAGKHNLFVQISGSRKFLLFPPECCRHIIPDTQNPQWGHVCKSATFIHTVSEASADPQEQLSYIKGSPYSSLAELWPRRVEVILHDGDAILIPAKWLHCTEILSFSVALNWWFPVDAQVDTDPQFVGA